MRGRTRTRTSDGPARGPVGVDTALVPVRHSDAARAAVLVLHGGRADSLARSRPWNVAALRMRPVVRAVAAAVPDDEVFLGQVRYRLQGWNGSRADPVGDVRRALAELVRLVGEVPVILVGHSMGGRAALRVAAATQVGGVVALAPWCPEGEPVAHLQDKKVIALHGDRDRVTDPSESIAFVRRARAAGSRAGVLLVKGGDHAMLRRYGTWHGATGAAVAELLRPTEPPGGLLARALSAADSGLL